MHGRQTWMDGFGAAVTVVDADLNILYMNEKSMATFEKYGGGALLGANLAGCHMGRSMETMKRILESGRPNVYTIEKAGVKKLIYQAPWRADGPIAGLVEMAFEIPDELPHFVRD